MNYDRIKPWENVVAGVASEYHKKFTMCDIADIKQSLYEWFIEHPNKLDSWEELGKNSAKNLIYRSLRNQALDYCQWWKAKSIGYQTDDLFYYTPEMVENLLPQILRDEEIDKLPVLNLGKTGGGHGTPAESGNMDTMIADISKGYSALSKDDKKAVFMRFALSFPFAEIAEQMELNTEDAARMRVKRAVKNIVKNSGGFKVFTDIDDELPDDKTSSEQEALEVYIEL